MSGYAEMTEDEKMRFEEQRLLNMAAKFDWNKTKTVNVVSPRRTESSGIGTGKRVVIYWLDRVTGHRVVEPMSVQLDPHGRLPIGFIQTEWNCRNIQLKDGPVLTMADGGHSLQAMPPSVHLELYADDLSQGRGRKGEAHYEVEITQDLQPARLPGMGLKTSTYETALPPPTKVASSGVKQFCGNCGGRLAGGRFCPQCGSPI